MADTSVYHEVENWVRTVGLPNLLGGQEFVPKKLQVGTKRNGEPAYHEFDAVSGDGSVLVSIKAGAGRTSGNKAPTGQIKDAYTEVLFLSLALGQRRVLALTDRRLYDEFLKTSDGKLPAGLKLLHVELPAELEGKLLSARRRASEEVSPRPVEPSPGPDTSATPTD